MRIVSRCILAFVLFWSVGLHAQNQTPTPLSDPFEGSWVGTVSGPNDRTEIGFMFTRGKHGLDAAISMPAMFLQDFPLGPAEIKDGTYTMADFNAKLSLTDGQLVGTFGNPLLRVELHRGSPLAATPLAPTPPSGPAPAWTHSLGSETWASPIAREGVVYVGSTDGKFHAVRATDGSESWAWAGPNPLYGQALATEDSLYFLDERTNLICLRRSDGQLQWRTALYDEKIAGKPARKNPTFNRRVALPVIVHRTVFVGSSDHGLYALDAMTGKILWRQELGASVYGAVAPEGDELVVGCADGSVVVLDRHSGAESARTKIGGPIASTPVIAGDTILVGCRDYLLYGLRRSDLGIAWRNTYWFSWVESVPQFVDGVAYIGGSDFRRISAIEPATGKVRWVTDVRGIAWGTPVVTADTVYIGTSAQVPAAIHHEGGMVALDRITGAIKWRHFVPLNAPAERAGYIGSLVLVEGKIVGAAFDGTLTAYPVR